MSDDIYFMPTSQHMLSYNWFVEGILSFDGIKIAAMHSGYTTRCLSQNISFKYKNIQKLCFQQP